MGLIVIPDSHESKAFLRSFEEYKCDILVIIEKQWASTTSIISGWQCICVESLEDHANVLELTRVYAKSKKYEQIVCFGERNVILASKIRTSLGMEGLNYPDAIIFRDKLRMKEHAFSKGIHVPSFVSLEELIEIGATWNDNKQCVLKPRMDWACKGVRVFDSVEMLIRHVENNPMDVNSYMVEEYVEARLVHVGGIMQQKAPLYEVVLLHRNSILDVVASSKLNHVYYSIKQDSIHAKRLLDLSRQVLNDFGLKDSFYEVEFLWDESESRIYLCEIAARPATGRSAYVHERMIAEDPYVLYADLIKRRMEGDKADKRLEANYDKGIAMLNIVGRSGVINEMSSVDDFSANYVINSEQKYKIGDVIDDNTFDTSLARFFIESSNEGECLSAVREVEEAFKYVIK